MKTSSRGSDVTDRVGSGLDVVTGWHGEYHPIERPHVVTSLRQSDGWPITEGRMKKRYYDAASLERVLVSLERRYGMSSAEFYDRHRADEPLPGVPGFHRIVWASFYRDVKRMRGDDFAEHARHVLELSG